MVKKPRTVSFQTHQGAERTQYRPDQIKSFSVANTIYTSAVVAVDVSPYKIQELSLTSEPNYIQDTVFLQFLFRSEKSLLYLKDQDGKNHFYIFDEMYTPLLFKQYIQSVYMPHYYGYKRVVYSNASYKTQIALYLNKCADIQEKMKHLKYEADPLIKLFTYYSEC